MSGFQAEQGLLFFSDHSSSLGFHAASLREKSAGGLEPEPELQLGPPAGVHPDWGVIGLSCRLVRVPMWATAVWRPGGTIWKQRDVLQRRRSFHQGAGPGYQQNKAGEGRYFTLNRFGW